MGGAKHKCTGREVRSTSGVTWGFQASDYRFLDCQPVAAVYSMGSQVCILIQWQQLSSESSDDVKTILLMHRSQVRLPASNSFQQNSNSLVYYYFLNIDTYILLTHENLASLKNIASFKWLITFLFSKKICVIEMIACVKNVEFSKKIYKTVRYKTN